MKNEENAEMIPYYAHEMEMTRMEIRANRLFRAIVAGIVLLVATNAAWIIKFL